MKTTVNYRIQRVNPNLQTSSNLEFQNHHVSIERHTNGEKALLDLIGYVTEKHLGWTLTWVNQG